MARSETRRQRLARVKPRKRKYPQGGFFGGTEVPPFRVVACGLAREQRRLRRGIALGNFWCEGLTLPTLCWEAQRRGAPVTAGSKAATTAMGEAWGGAELNVKSAHFTKRSARRPSCSLLVPAARGWIYELKLFFVVVGGGVRSCVSFRFQVERGAAAAVHVEGN